MFVRLLTREKKYQKMELKSRLNLLVMLTIARNMFGQSFTGGIMDSGKHLQAFVVPKTAITANEIAKNNLFIFKNLDEKFQITMFCWGRKTKKNKS